MIHHYLFVLGRTPELGLVELRHFFPDAIPVSEGVVRIANDQEISAVELIAKLGGTVKIAKELGLVSALSAQSLVHLLGLSTSDVHFGVSVYGATLPGSLLREMKELLEQKGIHARYASSRHGETLSSVTVDKQHLVELVVVKTQEGYLVGLTQAVQPYEEWGKRDYGRPYADAKSGMLPPKVARMLVNIAHPTGFGVIPGLTRDPSSSETLDSGSEAGMTKGMTLLDPFCGMGTVLSEAYLAGWRVIGADISKEAVRKAQANLQWIVKEKPVGAGEVGNIFVGDAVHVSSVLPPNSIHAVVTEPFMGTTDVANKPHIDPQEVKNTIKGLEKLYIGCLRDWSNVLVPGGVIIIALPEYAASGRVYFVKKVIDMCENLGYTIEQGPIAYSRPQATVRRKFYLFRKK